MKKIILINILIFSATILNAQLNDFVWSKAIGATGAKVNVTAITKHAASNSIYAVGTFNCANIQFGTTTLKNDSVTTEDVFVAKYNTSGKLIWATRAGGKFNDKPNAVATDAAGNVYITGQFVSSKLQFDNLPMLYNRNTSNTNNTYTDIFIVKYDSTGKAVWARQAGCPGLDGGMGVAVDASNNVYVTGFFRNDTLKFGNLPAIPKIVGQDIFLVKYDATGNAIWAKSAQGSNNDQAQAITVDATGNIFLCGYYGKGKIQFGTNDTLRSDCSWTPYIAKYDTIGKALWSKSAIGTVNAYDVAMGIVTDAAGNAYMTGVFNGKTLQFGNLTPLTKKDTSQQNGDVFTVKYDAAGNAIWAKQGIGVGVAATGISSSSIAIDASSNLFITGSYSEATIQFGNKTLTNNGVKTFDIFLTQYDASGNVLMAKSIGKDSTDLANAITIDASGSVYIGGNFVSPTLQFGNNTALANSGINSMFIAKYGSTTNIKENNICNNNVSIYPIPAKNTITIELKEKTDENTIMNISNIAGQTMVTKLIISNKTNVDVSTFTKGVYIINIKNNKQNLIYKFIVE